MRFPDPDEADPSNELERILAERFRVTHFQRLQARAFLHQMRAVDLEKNAPEPPALARVPAEVARRHRFLPLTVQRPGLETRLVIAVDDCDCAGAIEAASQASGLRVQAVLADLGSLEEALERCYPPSSSSSASSTDG